ncbi:type II toxin-antitoxin system HicA family toxin [Candidatus Saccharibacteria bacterium]|nr:type II toxin-antitoxin system HicA family toxin [Candidatus Saccharibacteria bacterium]
MKSLGFVWVGGKSHDKYVAEKDGKTVVLIIPRHATISPGTVNNIVENLVKDFGVDLDEVKKNIR